MNDTIVREAVNMLRNTVPPLTWQAVAREYHQENLPNEMSYRIALQYYYTTANPTIAEFRNFWRGLNGLEPIEPPPLPALAILARDAQNVHTAPVSAQTNAGMEKLLATNVPKTQTTEIMMMKYWIALRPGTWNEMLRVANDVNRWFNTKTCRAENDTLYRRVLRGLVATIEASSDNELCAELYKRLWQECQEAVGLCCEGHLTRLCNVMVGFDDAFKPQVALGELMQQKMAAIAGLDVSEEEKRRQANAWFDEVAVPQEERVAWLEAF